MADVTTDLAILLYFPKAKDRGYPFDRFWTGAGNLRLFDGIYSGTNQLLALSPIESAIGEPTNRIEVVIAATDAPTRRAAANDRGFTTARLNFIRRQNNSWVLIPRQMIGVVSEPRLTNTTYVVTLETQTGYRPSRKINQWSNASMRERVNDPEFGGEVTTGLGYRFLGFTYLAQLEQGLVNLDWPPLS